ncbi:uncharacterized protein LOC142230918 [Haematobia irritans]|uniref:uncharacterized protein LOC142230918 n=1 Tax=Haematobia irritans TaxID=7368 RepID=UPI003F50D089
MSIFELNTVTYGTTSAPYLAIRVLQKLAEDYKSYFPSAAEVLKSESYVDDIISGSDNLSDASKLQKDLCALLNKGGCNLRKWVTNSQELLAGIPIDCRDPSISIDFDRNNNVVKTLGIQWNTNDDTFSIRVNFDERYSFSKRSILSESARIYDPLGLLTPSTVVSKTIFKRLWEDSIDWDSKIPDDIEEDWINHRSSLKDLSNLKSQGGLAGLQILPWSSIVFPDARRTGILTSTEINDALYRILKVAQKIDFPIEIEELSNNRAIRNSSLLKLMPFLDRHGLIRVGGRLQNSTFAYYIKHPIILSKNYPLSKLIITDSHEKTLHGGITLTMSYVNRRYWILSGNQLAKSIIHKCMRCFRQSAKTAQQIMGNLPSVRLNATRPFKHSGVDFAGPIMLKTSTIRSAVVRKGYICLFVCMVTKALHLEAVSDLSTSAFLAASKRFVSRRGACTDIYSDCGTNFVGASKELQVLHNRSEKSLPEELRHALNNDGTTWHFIPPASPNFGGLWEAGVKSVKYHLKRVVHDRLLSFEELSTLLCQIESCLNSRPLCPLSPDPADFDALTPAHFLIGEPTNCIQDETLLDVNINRLSRWKCIEKIKQHFLKRWRSEYLNRLQSRPKWLKQSENAKVGDLVLVADDALDQDSGYLAEFEEIHPGADGRTRLTITSTDNH